MKPAVVKPAAPSEFRIMKYILAQLGEKYPDGLWERQNVVVAQADDRIIKAGTPGQADIRGCYKGRYIELEVKKPGEVQTALQKKRELRIKNAGGTYAVVRSPNDAFAVIQAL